MSSSTCDSTFMAPQFQVTSCGFQVLSPVQAAVLHVQAGRDPMESMAFCNFVAEERQAAGSAVDTTAEAALLRLGPVPGGSARTLD